MSTLLGYICCAFIMVMAVVLSLAALGLRDMLRGVASKSRSTVARGVAFLVVAVAIVVLSYRLWLWWIGPP